MDPLTEVAKKILKIIMNRYLTPRDEWKYIHYEDVGLVVGRNNTEWHNAWEQLEELELVTKEDRLSTALYTPTGLADLYLEQGLLEEK